jgi:hypothetical protein
MRRAEAQMKEIEDHVHSSIDNGVKHWSPAHRDDIRDKIWLVERATDELGAYTKRHPHTSIGPRVPAVVYRMDDIRKVLFEKAGM